MQKDDATARTPVTKMTSMPFSRYEEADSSRQFEGLLLSDGGYQAKVAASSHKKSSNLLSESDTSFSSFAPSDTSFIHAKTQNTGARLSTSSTSSFASPIHLSQNSSNSIGRTSTSRTLPAEPIAPRYKSFGSSDEDDEPYNDMSLSASSRRPEAEDEDLEDLTAKLLPFTTAFSCRPFDVTLLPETFQVPKLHNILKIIFLIFIYCRMVCRISK